MKLSQTFSFLSLYLTSFRRVPVSIKPRLPLYHSSSTLARRFCISATMSSVKGSKVYITRRVPSGGIKLLEEAGCQLKQWAHDDAVPSDELLKGVSGVDAIFCLLSDKIDKAVLDAAGSQLKVVATLSVGFDHIDIEECHRRNILIGYTPEVLTRATAELAVALLLATSRNIPSAINAVRNGEWGTWKPLWLCGAGLDGSTVGIVGMGRIGNAIAGMLKPFGVSQFLYTSRSGPRETKVPAKHVDLPTLLKESDFVIASCALSPETKGMFNASTFSQMKKTAIFVNISRGTIVNQDDLIQALQNGTIRAAGLDVTTPEPLPLDSPLLQLKNCVVLPHIGSATEKARETMSELTARNIIAALDSKPMPSQLKP